MHWRPDNLQVYNSTENFQMQEEGKKILYLLNSNNHTSIAKPEIIAHFRLRFPFYIHSPFLASLLIIYIACTLRVVSF